MLLHHLNTPTIILKLTQMALKRPWTGRSYFLLFPLLIPYKSYSSV